MSTNIKIIGGAIVAVILSVLGVHLFSSPNSPVAPANYGAVSSPDLPFNYLCVGGNCSYKAKVALTASSSVICAIQNPTGATTTLAGAGMSVNGVGGFTVSPTMDISTSTSQYGSSTPAFVYAHTLTATPGSIVAYYPGTQNTSATIWGVISGDGSQTAVIAPNQYVTFRIATSSAGTFAGGYLTGFCSAEFRSLQ